MLLSTWLALLADFGGGIDVGLNDGTAMPARGGAMAAAACPIKGI